MPTKSSKTNIGLTSSQLSLIYPYHIVIGRDLTIIQVGDSLKPFQDHLLSKHIGTYLKVTSPPRFPWSWATFAKSKTHTFDIELNDYDASRKLGLKCLPLRGGIVINDTGSDSGSDSGDSSRDNSSVIFLFSLNFKTTMDLTQAEFRISDINKFTAQRALFMSSK